MKISVHQPQYLPWLGYFDKIAKSDCFVFLDKVQYKHREYQNRNKILTKDGQMWLTVPVVSKGLGRQLICDVNVDNSLSWQKDHLRSLESWYGRAKFFKDHIGFFQDIYTQRKWDRLMDLNVCIIQYIMDKLDINTPVYLESQVGTSEKSTKRIIEICSKIGADTYLSGSGGKAYLDEDKFDKAGIKLKYQEFTHPRYRQCFIDDAANFIPNLSVIDLIFNEGPVSKEILEGKN